ncbi:acetyltransferase [Chryseobacterium sp. Leaf394]|uniref:acyltransferase n=1 Tax=Chryseobacterium sp. Leaf394 TaxID=1736361 RepID=UPI0006F7A6C6|nr:acetyltransferase [Chryseobacterium sp. Leaf394]KQS93229.1 acetyltransferase [Chryseobacterium sp. Leaf394]
MTYSEKIKGRSKIKYFLGLLARIVPYVIYSNNRRIARKNGATIGDNVIINKSLAQKANSNLHIGNNTSIQTDKIDTRARVHIGENVIIGQNVEIITVSHNIDSEFWENKYYGLEIEDYSWIATNAFILPSCRKIEFGTVIAARSVVVSNTMKMAVVSGNPAKEIKKRKTVHSELVVPSLLSGDLQFYLNARKI